MVQEIKIMNAKLSSNKIEFIYETMGRGVGYIEHLVNTLRVCVKIN